MGKRRKCSLRIPAPSSQKDRSGRYIKILTNLYIHNYFITALSHMSEAFYYFSFFRYGNIYKTYILGCPCIMVASPEAAKAVLVTQANLFKPTYPRSKENMIGPEAIFFNSGTYHAKLKKLVQANFLPATIKGFVPDIEAIVLKILPTWKNKKIITLKEMKMVHTTYIHIFFFFFWFLFLFLFWV